MAGLQRLYVLYLVRVLKLNSLGTTQTKALTLNTLVPPPSPHAPLETISLLYGMSLNKIIDSNKTHTLVCFLVLCLTSLSIPSVHTFPLSLILFFSQPLSGNITISAPAPRSGLDATFRRACCCSSIKSRGAFSPRAVLGLRCTARPVLCSLSGYMPHIGVDCGICGPFCLSGEE